MQEHIQRLQRYLGQRELSPKDARDGIISAYVVISRLNQTQGNPDVGLKQDEAGLQQHISGFMGAVFWERGFDFEHPSVEQLNEIKMMLDGMAQVYDMPENLQMAVNEICDYLLSRAGGQPAMVSPAVMDLLGYEGGPVEVPESTPEPAPAAADEIDTDVMPESESEAAPEPEAEPAAESPAFGAKGASADESQMWATLLQETEVTSDRPDEPRADRPAAGREEPLAPEPPKKKRSRKKSAGSEDGQERKPARRRGKKTADQKKDAAEITVPDDYLTGEEEAPRPAPAGPEPAPSWTEPEPVVRAAEERAQTAEPEEAPLTDREIFAPPAPPTPEPQAEAKPFSLDEERGTAESIAPGADRPRSGGRFLPWFMGLLLGLALGAGGAYYYLVLQQRQTAAEQQRQVENLQRQLNQNLAELSSVEDQYQQLKNQYQTAWAQPPAGLKSEKSGKRVILYWQDPGDQPGSNPPVRRKYFLYGARGSKAKMKKLTQDPLDKNFIYLSKPRTGTWRFAVSALDTAGQETGLSEELKVKFSSR